MKKKRIKPLSLLLDVLIDFVLIGAGCLVYYHFLVRPLVPVDLNPAIFELVGSKQVVVWVIAGLLVLVGAFNLLKTFVRVLKSLVPKKTNS